MPQEARIHTKGRDHHRQLLRDYFVHMQLQNLPHLLKFKNIFHIKPKKYGHVSTWTFFGHSAEIGKTKVLEDHEGTNTSNEIEKTRNQSISKDIGNCGADFCLLFGQLFSSNKDDCFGCNYLQGVVDYKAYVQHRVGSCG